MRVVKHISEEVEKNKGNAAEMFAGLLPERIQSA